MDGPYLDRSDGLASRPLTAADAQAITELIAACQRADEGEVAIDVADVKADWARPDFDPSTMSVGVFDGERLVAAAQIFQGRADVNVAPGHRDRGLDESLMRWSWQAARADGQAEVTQYVADDSVDTSALLRANGYRAVTEAWILRIDLAEEPPPPVLPEGISFRDRVPGRDDRRIYDVVHTAFADFGHRSQGFENWVVTTLHHGAARPDLVVLAVDGDEIVGVSLGVDYGPSDPEGWVEHLAVERAYRGRGIGGALLRESFRRFRRAGKPRAGLSTNSDTGALGLYLHVGMHVARSYTRYAKHLT